MVGNWTIFASMLFQLQTITLIQRLLMTHLFVMIKQICCLYFLQLFEHFPGQCDWTRKQTMVKLEEKFFHVQNKISEIE